MPPMGKGRGRGFRARKAVAVEPRELKQPQMQSIEKPGNAEEKIQVFHPCQPAQEDFSKSSIRTVYAPLTTVTNVASPLLGHLYPVVWTHQHSRITSHKMMSTWTVVMIVVLSVPYTLQFCRLLRMFQPVHGPTHHAYSEVPRDFVSDTV